MRNVINLNKDWAFIQQDAGLPQVCRLTGQRLTFLIPGMLLTDMTETAAMTEENTGMPKPLKHQNSLLAAEKSLWKFWQQDSRQLFM